MQTEKQSFDEHQSLQVIKAMIEVSQSRLKSNGILFIVWGWVMFYTYISSFVLRHVTITYQVNNFLKYSGNILGIVAVAYTLYFIFTTGRKATSYIAISLRYVWIALVICLSLINIILFNALNELNVELQHPVFMVFIAFATVVTGGIIRYKPVIAGGIMFGILAFISSRLTIDWQMLCEAIAWLVAFVIPGHYLYAKRKS